MTRITTWRHSRDTSTEWAIAVASSVDAAYLAPGAIPWLKLQVRGAQYGPDGGAKLTATKFIQRVNTAGGVAPATGCAPATDIGKGVFVPSPLTTCSTARPVAVAAEGCSRPDPALVAESRRIEYADRVTTGRQGPHED